MRVRTPPEPVLLDGVSTKPDDVLLDAFHIRISQRRHRRIERGGMQI
jgi:hypothetical protein